MVGMLKEQQKQDKQLELIQRLEKELLQVEGRFRHLCGLSVFRLPPQSPIPVSKDENGKEMYLVDKNPAGLHPNINRVLIEDGVLHSTPSCIWGIKQFLCVPIDSPLPLQKWKELMLPSTEDILYDLALVLLPNMHHDKVLTGHRLVEVVLKQRNKKRAGKWSKFLRLRYARNDQDEAKGWFGGMVSNQSMEQEKVRKEQGEAKYWWIDIPDLTGLVLKILPTLERQRKGTVDAEAVLWELKKDIDTARLPRNTSNNQLGERYGCSGHTVAKAAAMLTEEERRLIPYSKASKAVSVRATRQEDCIDNFTGGGSDQVSSRHTDRQEENKLTRLREAFVQLLVDEGFPSDQAWDMAMKYQTSATMQKELNNSTQNLK